MKPHVSVITRSYNYAHYLPQCLTSVIEQSFDQFELIVVDDGSTDATEEVVKSFTDPRLRYVQHDDNRGPGAAFNTGLDVSEGQYVACLDADDVMNPGNLAAKVDALERLGDIALVYSDAEIIDAEGRIIGAINADGNARLPCADLFRRLLYSNFIVASSVMVRKESYDRIGPFDVALTQGEDLDMWLRLAHQYEFAHVEGHLVQHRVHPGSLQYRNLVTNQDLHAVKTVIDQAFERFELEASGYSREHLYRSHYFKILGQKNTALPLHQVLRLYARGIADNPKRFLTIDNGRFVMKTLAYSLIPSTVISGYREQRNARNSLR